MTELLDLGADIVPVGIRLRGARIADRDDGHGHGTALGSDFPVLRGGLGFCLRHPWQLYSA